MPLCASCQSIQKSIRKYENLVERERPKSKRVFDFLAYELAVARRMKESAQLEGMRFENIHARPMDALDLEHIFVGVSKIAVRRELFDSDATLLNEHFSKPQQRLLFFMMSEIIRANNCKHRKFNARNSLTDI
jgi:hypothetical protein